MTKYKAGDLVKHTNTRLQVQEMKRWVQSVVEAVVYKNLEYERWGGEQRSRLAANISHDAAEQLVTPARQLSEPKTFVPERGLNSKGRRRR